MHPISVKPGAALVLAGLATHQNADNVASIRIARGTYPFPLRPVPKYSRTKVVLISDIEATMRGVEADPPLASPITTKQSRRRGRPRRGSCVASSADGIDA